MVGADDEGAGRWDDDWDDDWEEGWDGEWEDDAALEDALAYQSAAMDETALVEGGGDDGADEGGGPADGAGGRRGRSLLRASALPAVGTTLSRATGLIRVGALTYALGLTTIADVYNLANTTPNILYELVLGGVLSSTLVPLFVRTLDDKDDDTASVVTTVAFSAIVCLTIIGVLLAPWINRLFALPLSGAARTQQLELGDDFLALLIPQILFYGVTTLVTALLHARRRFAPPAFTPILTNLVTAAAAVAAALWVTSDDGNGSMAQVYVLGLGTTAGVAAMAIAMVPYLRRSGITLQWRFKPRHPAVRSVLRLSGWTIGFAVGQPDRAPDHPHPGPGPGGGRGVGLPVRLHLLPAPPRPHRGVAHDRGAAGTGRGRGATGTNRPTAERFREGLEPAAHLPHPRRRRLPVHRPAADPAVPAAGQLRRRGHHAHGPEMLLGFAFGLPAFSVFLYAFGRSSPAGTPAPRSS